MRIAYIFYEHPLSISGGGIGTYSDQIASVMARFNHDVEVFSGSKTGCYESILTHHYKLHLIPAASQEDFRLQVTKAFALAHETNPFDLIEGAEYGADTLSIKKLYPDIKLIIKLHTPKFLVKKLNFVIPSFFSKLHFILGGLLKGEFPKPYWNFTHDSNRDPEQELYCIADSVSSPSASLANIVRKEWGDKEIIVLPNPFQATGRIPVRNQSSKGNIRVLFIGRLERRKGIYDLAQSIPIIFKKNPAVTFGFAGSDQPSIKPGLTTKKYLLKKFSRYSARMEFFGLLTTAELNKKLDETDICVFPSLWENFPNACLEAMLAEKAVIASKNGGMAEMISHLENGYLISPNAPEEIAAAVLELSANHDLRLKLGKAAREQILKKYDATTVGLETELLYRQTLNKKK